MGFHQLANAAAIKTVAATAAATAVEKPVATAVETGVATTVATGVATAASPTAARRAVETAGGRIVGLHARRRRVKFYKEEPGEATQLRAHIRNAAGPGPAADPPSGAS